MRVFLLVCTELIPLSRARAHPPPLPLARARSRCLSHRQTQGPDRECSCACARSESARVAGVSIYALMYASQQNGNSRQAGSRELLPTREMDTTFDLFHGLQGQVWVNRSSYCLPCKFGGQREDHTRTSARARDGEGCSIPCAPLPACETPTHRLILQEK